MENEHPSFFEKKIYESKQRRVEKYIMKKKNLNEEKEEEEKNGRCQQPHLC